jgi:hypothetical protein
VAANKPKLLRSRTATRGFNFQRFAESLGFKGEFRQWEHLLRIGELHALGRSEDLAARHRFEVQ